ncbi:hypothetical protein [Pedosphaera parvula]|uniref:Uncharacterized protein n=1 Tax=Pedosphaera parvula (strain Ellin514) TaxID=320771 RepID=B9XNU3_PEDPL|nr:hypothetical protein [Pedosphaera parvula]EEF58516.1 hypothetical protein Cflav_PD1243 [Pedosphaera parvula Ellin514]
MKLHYRILWFEDNAEYVKDDFEPDITAYLDSFGFQVSIDWRESRSGTTKYDLYDLIITDLNLAGNHKANNHGGVLLKEIRDHRVYTEILFYSGSPEMLTKELNRIGPIERVSLYAGRGTGLLDKIKQVIFLTIRKVQSVNNARGLVIAETIDIESKMLEVVDAFLSRNLDVVPREVKIKRLQSFLKEKIKFLEKQARAVADCDPEKMDAFCKQKFLTASDSLRLFLGCVSETIRSLKEEEKLGNKSKVLDAGNRRTRLEAIFAEMKTVEGEIISLRNSLAHVREEQKSDGSIVLKNRKQDGAEFIFDDKWCVKVRKDLRRHSQNLVELSSLL